MRCNWRRWLWGIIPLLVLSWVVVQAEHSRLERDLAERTRLALVHGGFPWALVEFKARDAVLTGRAPQEGEPGRAADALASVWGVRVRRQQGRPARQGRDVPLVGEPAQPPHPPQGLCAQHQCADRHSGSDEGELSGIRSGRPDDAGARAFHRRMSGWRASALP